MEKLIYNSKDGARVWLWIRLWTVHVQIPNQDKMEEESQLVSMLRSWANTMFKDNIRNHSEIHMDSVPEEPWDEIKMLKMKVEGDHQRLKKQEQSKLDVKTNSRNCQEKKRSQTQEK